MEAKENKYKAFRLFLLLLNTEISGTSHPGTKTAQRKGSSVASQDFPLRAFASELWLVLA
jgi:hypothetical protein